MHAKDSYMFNLLKKTLFSTRLMAFLFLAFALAMAIGTFVESAYSTETARIYIYNATWFEVIMVFFVINFTGNIFRYNLLQWKKWPVLVLHLSWILIIIGAGVTRYIGYEGMMPIREGKSEKVFYSDKTYLTVFIDGDINGETRRRVFEDDILVTPEGKRSSLPWKSDFNGQPFQIDFVDFKWGANKQWVADENGKKYLKIVEAGDGQRHEHYLEEGKIANIHNILFSLNKETQGAINIITTDSIYNIKPSFDGGFMRMADQFKGEVFKDSLQQLQLRSLYTMAGTQFVIPEPVTKGKYIAVPSTEPQARDGVNDTLVLKVTANEKTHIHKLTGEKGMSEFSDKFSHGNLDFSFKYGSKEYELPFNVKLNDFIAEKYPGTESNYKSFMSKISVEDERPFDYDIFMNHVLDHKGYRFFQASFMPDEKGTILSVNHDRWGTWITYAGYFLLYLGLMGIMFFGKTRFKDLTKTLAKLKAKKASLSVIVFLLVSFGLKAQAKDDDHAHNTLPSQAQVDSVLKATVVSKEHAAKFGALIIQDANGRMKPVNTFSSELLRKLSGKNSFNDMNSDQVFLSMMLNPAIWYNTEFISLAKKENDSIREIVGVPKTRKLVKAIQFFDEKGNYKLQPYMKEATSTNNPNQFQKDFKKAHERLSLLDLALSGQMIKIFPLLTNENNKWISAVEFRSGQFQVQDSLYANFMNNGVPYYLNTVQKSISSGDYSEADKLLAAFHQNQKNYGAEVLPSEEKVQTEIIYNKLDIFNRLYQYYALVGGLLFFILIIRIFKDRELWKAATYFLKGLIILLFIWHTAGLVLRWYISGHAPWSDAYESILYVSWATMGMGFLLGARKSDLTLAASAFVTAMLLWIAHQSWVDPSIANLVPVLDSYWLMIHVAVIVGSYGPLTVGMILGVVSLILIILTTEKNKKRMEINLKELVTINELALTVGLIMLTIGNFLGGQWANESWGRYWGWDPKETWALISIMIYAFVLHMRLVPGLRGKWIFSFASIIAFASIMMTYFGVNFYLVGLHSYASGDQVITPDFIWFTVLGVLILGAISFWRYRTNYSK